MVVKVFENIYENVRMVAMIPDDFSLIFPKAHLLFACLRFQIKIEK
jgi:hypothetical protein